MGGPRAEGQGAEGTRDAKGLRERGGHGRGSGGTAISFHNENCRDPLQATPVRTTDGRGNDENLRPELLAVTRLSPDPQS